MEKVVTPPDDGLPRDFFSKEHRAHMKPWEVHIVVALGVNHE